MADLPDPPQCGEMARSICRDTIKHIAWAYGQSRSIFEPLGSTLLRDIDAIVRDAYELSLIVKRDITSVRLSIYLDDRLNRPFDPRKEESSWPQMGARAGDTVIGHYSFGLRKCTQAGDVSLPILPRVITTALLRELEKNNKVV